MSHFAQLDENLRVIRVIVAEQDFINTGLVGPPSSWQQTSYNTIAGQHRQGGEPFRKNYAAPGMIFDPLRDAFYWPRPDDTTWIFDEATCTWQRPIAYPEDGQRYVWDESMQNWKSL